MSYEIKVKIVTGNMAFGETVGEEADEVVRILRDLARHIEAQGNLVSSDNHRLIDFCGNKVGTITVEPC